MVLCNVGQVFGHARYIPALKEGPFKGFISQLWKHCRNVFSIYINIYSEYTVLCRSDLSHV